MSSITLTKTETRLLTDSAGRAHGLLVLPRGLSRSEPCRASLSIITGSNGSDLCRAVTKPSTGASAEC